MSTNTMINWKPENVVNRLPWRLDSKAAVGFLLILATFSLVGWLYLTQASAVTATRYRIDRLRLELDQLENQNAALALEIAQLENISRIEVRARELGLGATTNVRYLPVANYPLASNADNGPVQGESSIPNILSVRSLSSQPESPIADWWEDTMDEVTTWLVKK